MSLDKKSVTITINVDPSTGNLVVSGDSKTALSGDGVVSYTLNDQTSLGLAWAGMSLRVNEPVAKAECLQATIDPKTNSIVVSCTPGRQPNPLWGAYLFYLSFAASKDGVAGAQWSFDPEIDCEKPN